MAALALIALVLIPAMGISKFRKYRHRRRAEKELVLENARMAAEHSRLKSQQTAYEPPAYEQIVSAYDVNRNVDDAVKRPYDVKAEDRAYQSQRSAEWAHQTEAQAWRG